MAKKVQLVRFHQSVHVPGVGEIGNTLPAVNKSYKGLSMSADESGVQVSANGVEFIVPWPNVVVAIYDKSEDSKAKTNK